MSAPTTITALLLLALNAPPSLAAPFVPPSDAEVVERLPTSAGDPSVRRVNSLRKQLAASPNDVALRLEIGRRYFDLAMAQGDPRYVGYASAAIGPLAQVAPSDATYWLLKGQLQQYGHDFAGALQSLDKASALDAASTEPISWRAAIYMVQARYAEALRECTSLEILGSRLGAQACSAYVHASTGKLAATYTSLAKELADSRDASLDLTLWVRTRLAEMAIRLQKPVEAQAHFKAAFALGVTDQFLLAAYADFLIRQKEPAEAIKLLVDWERSDILLLRLALAGRAANDARTKAWVEQLRERFSAAAQRRSRLHEQEAARFELDLENNPGKALELAKSNYTLQKEPRDAEMLLRAALRANDVEAAEPALAWLRSSGFEDPALTMLATQLAGAGGKR